MARSAQYKIITDNLVAVFGERRQGTHERSGKIGRKRVKLVVLGENHSDLRVWTDSPRRSSQGVLSCIDLREPGVMKKLAEKKIVLM